MAECQNPEDVGPRLNISRIGRSVDYEIILIHDGRYAWKHTAKLGNATSRANAIDANLEKSPRLIRNEVESQVLETIQRSDEQIEREQDEAVAENLASNQIVHPERFILENVSGLSFPVRARVTDEIVTRFLTYVEHEGGRRECHPLTDQLQLAEDLSVIVDPSPIINPMHFDHWSVNGRNAWLEGASPPTLMEVFERVSSLLDSHVDFPDHDRDTKAYCDGRTATYWQEYDQATWTAIVSLWVIGTYGYNAFAADSYLWATGPTGSGKSKLLRVLGELTFYPLPTSNASPASVFRSIDGFGTCLLLDEAENIGSQFTDKHDLVTILNAGYERGGYVTRAESDGDGNFTIRYFRAYSPEAIAGISVVKETLRERSIHIRMFRSRAEAAKRTVEQDVGVFAEVRDALFAFAISSGGMWHQLSTCDIPELTGRPLQLWRPILALATRLADEDPDLATISQAILSHINLLSAASPNDSISDAEIVILQVLWDLLTSGAPTPGQETDGITCEKIRARANGRDAESMKRVSSHKVGRILRKFGIRMEVGHRRTVDQESAERRIRRIEKEYGVHVIPEPLIPDEAETL